MICKCGKGILTISFGKVQNGECYECQLAEQEVTSVEWEIEKRTYRVGIGNYRLPPRPFLEPAEKADFEIIEPLQLEDPNANRC